MRSASLRVELLAPFLAGKDTDLLQSAGSDGGNALLYVAVAAGVFACVLATLSLFYARRHYRKNNLSEKPAGEGTNVAMVNLQPERTSYFHSNSIFDNDIESAAGAGNGEEEPTQSPADFLTLGGGELMYDDGLLSPPQTESTLHEESAPRTRLDLEQELGTTGTLDAIAPGGGELVYDQGPQFKSSAFTSSPMPTLDVVDTIGL